MHTKHEIKRILKFNKERNDLLLLKFQYYNYKKINITHLIFPNFVDQI